jgi:hypothetical protein
VASQVDPALLAAGRNVRQSVSDDETYVLLPEGEDSHFLGEEILVGIALVMMAAFLKGVKASLEGRAETWGKDAGNWIADRVEGLLKADDPPQSAAENDLSPALEERRSTDADERDDQVAADLLANALIVDGMSTSAARSAATAARTETARLLSAS